MRRNAGLKRRAAAQKKEKRLESLGKQMEQSQITHMQTQMDLFKTKLEEFANKHKRQIRTDPVFRQQFQKMCSKIGVDPLASNKGVWAQLGVSQFYTELSIQIVDVCLSTRPLNGGLIEVDDLISYINAMKGSNRVDISEDDIVRAVNKLEVLRGGFRVERAGSKTLVVSVPIELNQDHSQMLKLAEVNQGMVNVQIAKTEYGWEEHRALAAIEHLQKEGICWVDDPGNGQSFLNYWFPSISLSFVLGEEVGVEEMGGAQGGN
jgi:ESCRT-II complex subunit VPS22